MLCSDYFIVASMVHGGNEMMFLETQFGLKKLDCDVVTYGYIYWDMDWSDFYAKNDKAELDNIVPRGTL